MDIGIKDEEIPEDITFPDIKSEPDEVSYVCVCLLLDTFFQCPAMSVVFLTSVFLATSNSSTFGNENGCFFLLVGGCVLRIWCRWEGLY